jgi:hypothetical protein
MLEALFRRLGCFSLGRLLGEAAQLFVPVLILMIVAEGLAHVPLPFHVESRLFLSLQLVVLSLLMLVLAWPVLILTKYFSVDERKQILGALLPWRRIPKVA